MVFTDERFDSITENMSTMLTSSNKAIEILVAHGYHSVARELYDAGFAISKDFTVLVAHAEGGDAEARKAIAAVELIGKTQ